MIGNCGQALHDYELDKHAASTRATRASLERTWLEYHEKAVRANPALGNVSTFPMTASSLATIAALMKIDNFRAFGNYVSWAKAKHISCGHDWTQQLDLEHKQALRSVNRGLGTARQSASFDIDLIGGLPREDVVRLKGQPIYPADLCVLGSLWVLREIEAAWATVGDIRLDMINKTFTWHLPVSKTDVRAKACTRSWGCTCSLNAATVCPFHRMVDYFGVLAKFLKLDINDLDKASPLFPDFKGKVITKPGAVQGMISVLSSAGIETRTCGGKNRFGGHSMRVTGSRFWISRGLEVYKVQIFARWGSSVILRYVSDIPIANLTKDLNRASASCSVVAHVPPTQPAPALLNKHIIDALEQIEALKAEVARLVQSEKPSFVQNTASHAWHKVLRGGSRYPPMYWKTCCGWPFGFLPHLVAPACPDSEHTVCNRCFPRVVRSSTRSSSSDEGSSD